MKLPSTTRFFYFFISILIFAACVEKTTLDPDEEALYDDLDAEMTKTDYYDSVKQARISSLADQLTYAVAPQTKSEILHRLAKEYESFNSDSALHYVNLNLRLISSGQIDEDPTRLKIQKADITSHAGLFDNAISIMRTLNTAAMDSATLEMYYSVYCGIYQYQREYSDHGEYTPYFEKMRARYIDSISMVAPRGSLNHIINFTPELVRLGKANEAVAMLKKELSSLSSGTRDYSILASILADVYKNTGDMKQYKYYLAQSAISDIRAAVKENMAIRALAIATFEDGDIERANRYLKKSIADANFFAARMRNAQSSKMLPIIDEAYNDKQVKMQRQLKTQVYFISALLIVLFLAVIWIFRQFRTVKKANKNVKHTNEELKQLSTQLADANSRLSEINSRLETSNSIKEEYAALFMEYCSATISTLQQYHNSLRVITAQGSRSALQKKLESSEMIDSALKEFYAKFDEAILNIYPEFVDKFNALLKEGEKTVLRSGEILNTELRIYALIRIGISDNNKIADFLRCSLSTVYTYRSKIKKRAIDPAEFENRIMDII